MSPVWMPSAFCFQSGSFGGVINRFDGKSKLMIADGVLKWSPNGNAKETYFKIQGEYFKRKETGELAFDINGDPAVNPFAGSASAFSSASSAAR